MITILAIDDEKNLLNLYKIRLTHFGYNVLIASNGEEALNILYENKVDLLIVDIMMPKMDGYEFLENIRKRNIQTPAIMVSAKGNIDSKKIAFNLGVDDYIVKPIDFEELVLRIKALLRRFQINESHIIEIGDTVLNSNDLTVKNKVTKHEITLTKTEFNILFKLLSYPERSFTKEQLYDEFWGYDSNTEIEIVKVFVSKIRSQISEFKDIDIKTIRGIGYKGIKVEKN